MPISERGLAAFTTMFSTTLTVRDAYPRVLRSAVTDIWSDRFRNLKSDTVYFGTMVILAGVTLLIISFLQSGIKTMMDIATTLSFLTTPVLAYINYRVVVSIDMPEAARPGRRMRILSWAGILFWTGFAVFYVIVPLVSRIP